MQDNTVEQAEKLSASKIGKFNTADDLLAAYNALESEFTKRCQLIKQLQAELDTLRAQAAENGDCAQATDAAAQIKAEREPAPSAPQPENYAQPVHEVEVGQKDNADEPAPPAAPATPVITADDVLNEIMQNACEYAEALCAIPEVMNACIASYKQRLIQPHAAPAPKGCAVIVPAQKPRTLSEAKRLADALLGC